MRTDLRLAALLPLLACALLPDNGAAQGVIVNLYPREVVADSVEGAAARVTGRAVPFADLTPAERDSATPAARRAVQALRSWSRLNDSAASVLWGSEGAALLPAANLTPGTDRAEIYTELAQALTGGWRIVLGTALAVEAKDGEEEPAAAQDTDENPDAQTGFRRFLAGGGNLSLAAMRPIAMRSRTYDSEVVIAVPRLWANVPSLSATDGVDDFGAEMAAEYQYLRYERSVQSDGSLSDRPKLPFLTASLRSGLVLGTHAFYRTVGRGNEAMFLYTVPRINLQFNNGVKLGVSYFYAFGAFSDQEALTFQIAIDPTRGSEPPAR